MKRLGCTLLTLSLLLSTLPSPAAAAKDSDGLMGKFPTVTQSPAFQDVPADSWYADSVDACYRMGLMTGTGADTFSPNTQMTMAQVLVVCAQLHNRLNGGTEIPTAPADWRKTALLDQQGKQTLHLSSMEYTSRGRDSNGNYVKVGFPTQLLSPLDGTTVSLSSSGTVLGTSLPIDAASGFIQFSKEDDEALEKLVYSIYHNSTGIPDWAMDAVYYLDTHGSPIYFAEYELNFPATRNQLIRALEDVLPPEALAPLGELTSPPDVDFDAYWNSTSSAGTTTDGNIGAFYRAGILAGTDAYGTYNGDAILDRAQLATVLRAVARPETRSLPVLKEYDLGVEYDLIPLSPPEGYSWHIDPYNGDPAIETQYLSTYDNPTLLYRVDGTLIQCEEEFEFRDAFRSDGLAVISKWVTPDFQAQGVIDQEGKTVLPCRYWSVSFYHNGILLAQEKENGPWKVFDAQGNPTGQTLSADCLGHYGVSENRVIYQDPDTGLYGFVDLDGNIIVPATYPLVGQYSQGLVPVSDGTYMGYLDLNGKLVIPLRYKAPEDIIGIGLHPPDLIEDYSFRDGTVVLTDPVTGKRGVIGLNGETVLPFQFSPLSQADDGWFWSGTHYYNRDGRVIDISTFCGDGEALAHGYALLCSDVPQYGYLDEAGRIAIPIQFSQAGPIYNNKALVKDKGQWYRLEITGPST